MADTLSLVSRYWIGHCPDPNGGDPASMRVKFTEREPGQFDHKPSAPFEAECWMGDHEGHTLYPCTAEEYEAADDD